MSERLQPEMQAALKAGQKVRLQALRMLATAVKNREVELGHELSDEEFVEIAMREAKRRKEAIEAYTDAGRPDRADIEREELQTLEGYLPEALAEEELAAMIEEAVAATGATGPQQMGAVMKEVMAKAKGRADGKIVSEAVKARLSGA